MKNVVRRSAIRWHLPLSAILTVCVLLTPLQAAAEIILDDFDESFEIILPQFSTGSNSLVIQPNIGPLGAERHSSIVQVLARPTGQIDADISHPSSLTIELDQLH